MKQSMLARVLLLAFACLLAGPALAVDYPDRPIHWVVPYPPGGTTDVLARHVAQAVSQVLGQPVVIDNRGGAGGQIAMNAVAKATPDGYTLLVSDASLATAPSLYKHLLFDPATDLQAVARFATVPHVVVVNPNVRAGSLGELIALSKKTPGALNFGSGGVGSPLHLAGEALRIETGIAWTHIPYKGAGPAVLAAISNEVQVATPSLPAALALVQADKLHALAAMSAQRLAVLPGADGGGAGLPQGDRPGLGRAACARRYTGASLEYARGGGVQGVGERRAARASHGARRRRRAAVRCGLCAVRGR